jgi:hypothetical protein
MSASYLNLFVELLTAAPQRAEEALRYYERETMPTLADGEVHVWTACLPEPPSHLGSALDNDLLILDRFFHDPGRLAGIFFIWK